MAVRKPVPLANLVVQDHQIEGQADRSTLQLMEHRWTALNIHGYSVHEYAEAIGRTRRLVQTYVKAWALHLEEGGVEVVTPVADLLEKATMSADTYVAAEAIARADNVGVAHVRQSRMPEVRRVREVIADAPPEQKAERARRYVETTRRSAQVRHDDEARRRQNTMQSAIDLEVELDKAHRALNNAVVVARGAEFGDSDITDRIVEVLAQVRLLTEQLSLAIAGTTGIDWDTEARKLVLEP